MWLFLYWYLIYSQWREIKIHSPSFPWQEMRFNIFYFEQMLLISLFVFILDSATFHVLTSYLSGVKVLAWKNKFVHCVMLSIPALAKVMTCCKDIGVCTWILKHVNQNSSLWISLIQEINVPRRDFMEAAYVDDRVRPEVLQGAGVYAQLQKTMNQSFYQ